MKKNIEKNLGQCPLCSRAMVLGPSVDEHHFIPKSKGGKAEDKAYIHRVCHNMLHRTFSENELARIYNTPEKCLENETVQNFVKWVSKKDIEYYDTVKLNNKRR